MDTPRTKLERHFDSGAIARLKADAQHDISVGEPGLATHAFAAVLVDEIHVFVNPIVVGGGKPGLPPGSRIDLDLVNERRFTNGAVHLHYRRR